MPIETVRVVFMRPEDVSAIAGVFTRVFDADNVQVGAGTSGQTGAVEFELPGEATPREYTLRFHLDGGAIAPKRILVYSPASLAPTATNDFAVYAETFSLGNATDPKLCRVSGLLVGANGKPRCNVDINFIPKFHAFVEGIRTVATGRFTVRTDKNGFLSVDLLRFGMYTVLIEGREPIERHVEVPNRSSVLLGHLLFPIVVSVAYAEPAPFTVARGQTLTLTPKVMASDYRELGADYDDVLYQVRDPAVASVQFSGERILVRGLQTGTTQLRATRRDNSIVYLPDFAIAGGVVPLTVT